MLLSPWGTCSSLSQSSCCRWANLPACSVDKGGHPAVLACRCAEAAAPSMHKSSWYMFPSSQYRGTTHHNPCCCCRGALLLTRCTQTSRSQTCSLSRSASSKQSSVTYCGICMFPEHVVPCWYFKRNPSHATICTENRTLPLFDKP